MIKELIKRVYVCGTFHNKRQGDGEISYKDNVHSSAPLPTYLFNNRRLYILPVTRQLINLEAAMQRHTRKPDCVNKGEDMMYI